MEASRLESGMTEVHMTAIPTQKDYPTIQEGIGIDPMPNSVIKMALAASMDESHPQAIFNFHHRSSLDFKNRHSVLLGFFVSELVSMSSARKPS